MTEEPLRLSEAGKPTRNLGSVRSVRVATINKSNSLPAAYILLAQHLDSIDELNVRSKKSLLG